MTGIAHGSRKEIFESWNSPDFAGKYRIIRAEIPGIRRVSLMSADGSPGVKSIPAAGVMDPDFVAPAEACHASRALFAALEAMEGDLHPHIHLENPVLFPQAMAMNRAATH